MRRRKLYYSDAMTEGPVRVDTLEQWRRHPVVGVQVLAKELDRAESGKSRVVWYQDERGRRLFYDVAFYMWQEDGPAGVTPDAVLHRWADRTGDSSVRVGDLSLDDLAAIDVKCGESLPDEKFNLILEMALNDPEIP